MSVGWSHHTALESRQVVLDVPTQSQEEAMGPTSWPLECMVWSCADQGKTMATKAEVELLKQHSLHVGVKWHGKKCFVKSCVIEVLCCAKYYNVLCPFPHLGDYWSAQCGLPALHKLAL